ncbi:porin [Lutimaribacter sp. EGI FJ00015]|uniref:Porin n=1 Tax=Lutimaribacter degradans TaxID=2945989 RepID=A0ACC5ZYW9_9RHOB|nr:porin [Lutimaribacter sp. EGI FJ00013]MCM2562544.1 porin [Lutimaribacter sp. EGI FJ00013]MCO0613701.1 porin [Lutimaribacter sp. EGI FJ00015]MCO0636816.1 porin [Lutimaribacter sp. EGI FJ00014]
MKNIILATTALIGTAGLAAAEVSISGYGRFGATYVNPSVGASTTNTASRLRLQFDVSAETDSGIVFGARQRIQTEESTFGQVYAGGWGNGARFYMSTNGLTVAMGNILGVIEAAPNLYLPTASAGTGLEGNGFYSLAPNTSSNGMRFAWTAYQSGSGATSASNGVEVLYSMNGFGVHVHSGERGLGVDTTGIGINYTFSGYTAALAYEDFDNGAEILFASLGGQIGQVDAAISYAKTDNGTGGAGSEADKWSLRGGYDFGTGLTAYGFVASEDNNAGESFGLGASYDLGGGVSLEGGITQTDDVADSTIVSLGAFFSF